jgi:hypothetical protein
MMIPQTLRLTVQALASAPAEAVLVKTDSKGDSVSCRESARPLPSDRSRDLLKGWIHA